MASVMPVTPYPAEPVGDVGERCRAARQRIRPIIGAVQPAVRMVGQPDAGQSGRVQDPHRTAAVLDPQRSVGDERVQLFAVELTGDRRVVADRADPAVWRPGTAFASTCASWALVRTCGGPTARESSAAAIALR